MTHAIRIIIWISQMRWGNSVIVRLFTKAATLSGIPGKLEVSGDSVAQMWLEGKLAEIVEYNEFDAFTTHLLWARIAHFSGLLSTEQYLDEQKLVRELLEFEISHTVLICVASWTSGIGYSKSLDKVEQKFDRQDVFLSCERWW